MTWTVPDWYALALLAAAAFRTWRLLGEDEILDRPRDWVTGKVGSKQELFVVCPWCLGAWTSLAWWLAYEWQPHWSLIAATPLAISAAVGLIAAHEPD